MPKVKVKILESIAGLADPDTAKLDAKYETIRARLRGRDKPPTEQAIKLHIEEMKRLDRYAEKPLGFKKEWSFRPSVEVMIEAALAEKWIEADICALFQPAKVTT